jgi:hypothetical protein
MADNFSPQSSTRFQEDFRVWYNIFWSKGSSTIHEESDGSLSQQIDPIISRNLLTNDNLIDSYASKIEDSSIRDQNQWKSQCSKYHVQHSTCESSTCIDDDAIHNKDHAQIKELCVNSENKLIEALRYESSDARVRNVCSHTYFSTIGVVKDSILAHHSTFHKHT